MRGPCRDDRMEYVIRPHPEHACVEPSSSTNFGFTSRIRRHNVVGMLPIAHCKKSRDGARRPFLRGAALLFRSSRSTAAAAVRCSFIRSGRPFLTRVSYSSADLPDEMNFTLVRARGERDREIPSKGGMVEFQMMISGGTPSMLRERSLVSTSRCVTRSPAR